MAETTESARAAHGSLDSTGDVVQGMLLDTLDLMNTAIFIYDDDWHLLFANGTALATFEIRVEQPIGLTIFELAPSWESGPFFPAIQKAAREKIVLSVRAHSARLDRWFELTTFPLAGGIGLHLADVDAEERAKRALATTLTRLRRRVDILDASRDAVYVQELDGSVSYWSRGAETLYGWSSDEVLGRQVRDFLYENAEDFEAASERLLATGSWTGDLAQLTKDGGVFTANCRWQAALDDGGRPLHLLCTVSHEAEHLRDQEKRFRAQRLESIGLLAGGIAHNLNNVLAPLLLTSQFIAANEPDPVLRELVESMQPTIYRGSEMIAQVLAYSRGNEGQRMEVDARLLLDEVESFCRTTMSTSMKVRVDVHLDHPFFVGDSTQIMQVLTNLVTNARDAMDGTGEVAIRAYNHDITPVGGTDGPLCGIAVEVSDTGPGMSDETIARAFEPFYSTKPVGEGTGLGLSTSLSIAQGHGGDLSILSTPGKGTRIQLLLPATDVTVASAPEPATPPPSPGRGTVLVVEDEETFRTIVRMTLEANGYATLGAAHGREAIGLLEDGGHRVDLVFTDLAMPEMDGREFERYLQENHPHIPVIASSGFVSRADFDRINDESHRRFLEKPFSASDLLEAVREELGGS